MTDPLPVPVFLRLALDFRTRAGLVLPELAGSALRGMLGAGLRRLEAAAATPAARSEVARLRKLLFAPEAAADGPLPGVDRAPPPFGWQDVFAPRGTTLRAGEPFRATLLLVGPAVAAAPLVLDALAEAPALDFFGVPGALELVGARELPPAPVELSDTELAVALVSPLRIKRDNRDVGPGRFDARSFVLAFLRRFGSLGHHWGRGESDLAPLARATRRVVLFDPELREWRAERWSSRQGRRIPLSGLVGSFALDLAAAPELLPLLALAPVLGVGRSITIGFGQVTIAPGRQACQS
jgi:hypothetical protein